MLRALWRSFVHCLFVEEEGAVVFYKDASGAAQRIVDPKAAVDASLEGVRAEADGGD